MKSEQKNLLTPKQISEVLRLELSAGETVPELANLEFIEAMLDALSEQLRRQVQAEFPEAQKRIKMLYYYKKPVIDEVKTVLRAEKYFGMVSHIQTTIIAFEPGNSNPAPDSRTVQELGRLELVLQGGLSSTVQNEQILIYCTLILRRENTGKLTVQVRSHVDINNDLLALYIEQGKWNAVQNEIRNLQNPLPGGLPGTGKSR